MKKLFQMRCMKPIVGMLFCFICLAVDGRCEEPLKVSVCQLHNDPAAYNHKLVQVTGFVSHGFEDFIIFDPSCSSGTSVWLEYGGVIGSGTLYCCGVRAYRKRPKQLVVEKIPIPLVIDKRFREFDKLVQRRPDSVVHATIVGRFFAVKEEKTSTGVSQSGYGHFGCCSLFAIQQVISVAPQDRDDLDYSASADQPNINKAGCGYRYLKSSEEYKNLIDVQRKAEQSTQEWRFSEPERIATEALAGLLNIDEKSITGIKQTRKAQGRMVYQWSPILKRESYMIVVSRPYWLSFYAKDPKRISWVITAAYESSCE